MTDREMTATASGTGPDRRRVVLAAGRGGGSGLFGTGRISLRTLVLIRWVAVVGQLATVLFVRFGLGFELPLGAVLAVIGVSVLLNLAATFQGRGQGQGQSLSQGRPPPRGQAGWRARLAERDALLYLGYDVAQLAVLLFLTGGLENPFAILLLAPLTVSAILVSRRGVIALTALAIGCLAVLAVWHYPLPGTRGLPEIYAVGVWLALSLAAVFTTASLWRVAEDARRVVGALAATQAALARQERLSAVGALAAAAAHELGSPLGTIAVVAREMRAEVPRDSPLSDDVDLLISQSGRCRDILAELARQPEPAGGDPFDRLDVATLVQVAAEPHRRPGVALEVEEVPGDDSAIPVVRRTPALMHGLGNLLQNALQFARRRVTARVEWTRDEVRVTIADDGPGFPAQLLGRLGEPYLSGRGAGAGGSMGLGIFIAANLLEHSRAELDFGNARSGGAQVVVRWRRLIFEAKENEEWSP